ncbi:hypothetical protein BgiBS90_009204, partial [Biomphalaria glabrata]
MSQSCVTLYLLVVSGTVAFRNHQECLPLAGMTLPLFLRHLPDQTAHIEHLNQFSPSDQSTSPKSDVSIQKSVCVCRYDVFPLYPSVSSRSASFPSPIAKFKKKLRTNTRNVGVDSVSSTGNLGRDCLLAFGLILAL